MSEVVTVVMPVYREKEDQLRIAIESIINQTLQDFRFIIVLDDPDNFQLKEVIESYAKKDSRISLYVNEKNSGCPFSKDRGIRLATTEYIAIMDADDISKPNRLEEQLHKIQNENLDIVAACVRVISDEGVPLYNMDNLPMEHNDIVKKMRVNNCMPHPTWFLRKSAYMELGGYTDMQGCEDYDFLIRAILGGYKLGVLKDILLDYRLSSKSVSRNNLYKQYLMMQYLQDKYYTHRYNYESYDDLYRQKYSDQRAEKYAKAALYFENAVAQKSRHQYFRMTGSLFLMVLSSKDYCMKVLRYVGQNK